MACDRAARARLRPDRLRTAHPLRLLAAACAVAAALGPAQAASDFPAGDFPHRAAGLWEVRSVGSQAAGLPPIFQCIGASTDTAAHHMDRNTGVRGACTFGPYRHAGTGWMAESVCRQSRSKVTSRAILTGDLASAYRIDTLVRYEPPVAGKKHEDREALEARRIGPCRPGQSPGDMMVPGMGTLNMVDGEFHHDRNQHH